MSPSSPLSSASSPPPTVATTTDPPRWWRRWWVWALVVVLAAAAVVIVLLVVSAPGNDPAPDEPAEIFELCTALGDERNRDMTIPDWQMYLDMSEWEMRQYIAANCRDLIDRLR